LSLPHASLSIGYGGHKYLYSRGIFYAPGVREYVVVPPPAGVLVSSIPDGHDQVIVDGVSYYVYNGVYYSRVTQGYRVTAPPPAVIVDTATVAASAPVAVSPAAKAPQAFTVNIPGPGAGYTTVIVKRSGQGFTGPQGEYYPEFPAVAQLQAMYVK
jgi:hypothetical protein